MGTQTQLEGEWGAAWGVELRWGWWEWRRGEVEEEGGVEVSECRGGAEFGVCARLHRTAASTRRP